MTFEEYYEFCWKSGYPIDWRSGEASWRTSCLSVLTELEKKIEEKVSEMTSDSPVYYREGVLAGVKIFADTVRSMKEAAK